jgi:hypothetical protein
MAHKKCSECGAPLEGFLYNTLGKIFGIKSSEDNSDICNKCEDDKKPTEKKKVSKKVKPSEEKKKETKSEEVEVKDEVKEAEDSEDSKEEEHKVEPKSAQQILDGV